MTARARNTVEVGAKFTTSIGIKSHLTATVNEIDGSDVYITLEDDTRYPFVETTKKRWPISSLESTLWTKQ